MFWVTRLKERRDAVQNYLQRVEQRQEKERKNLAGEFDGFLTLFICSGY